MLHRLNLLGTPLLATVLMVAGFAFQQSTAFAQGAADRPLAHIEHSINCNNAESAFCEGQASGGWFAFTIDAGGTGTIAGAFCWHTTGGVGGPGGAGAVPVRQAITWAYSNLADGLAAGAELFAVDPDDSYYLVSVPVGEDVEMGLFPTTVGHYSYHPEPGVAAELQVAP